MLYLCSIPADIFDPATPYPFYKLHPLFRPGALTSAKGESVSWEALRGRCNAKSEEKKTLTAATTTVLIGKSVALYFGDDAKCKCKTFLPVLLNAYRTFNESG